MKARWNSAMVGGIALSMSIYGCVSMPSAQNGGMDRLGQLVRGSEAAARSNLQLSVVDRSAPNAKAGYHVNYLNVLDWDFARATLDKVKSDGAGGWITDTAFTAKSGTKSVTVSSSNLVRSAVVTLSNLAAGPNYRITVQLVKVVNGVEKILAQGVNDNTDHSGFTINTGSNSIDVTLALTSDGKAIVNVPPPGVSTTLSTTITAQSNFSAIRYAGVTLTNSGTNSAITASTPLMSVGLQQPSGLEIDENGNLFVSDSAHNEILKMDGTNATIYGGTGTAGVTGDGSAATAATLSAPRGLAYVPSKKALYIADYSNNRIRMIDGNTGNIYTVAGGGTTAVSTTGVDATTVALSGPSGVVIDSVGNIYFSETGNSRVCKVDVDGLITTIATGITNPEAIAIDRTNKVLWVSSNNLVKKITSFDTTPAAPATVYTFSDANDRVHSLTYDHNGTLYFTRTNAYLADRRTTNAIFRAAVASTGSLDTGNSPEMIAGNTFDTVNSAYGSISPTTAVTNALTQGFAGPGVGGLVIDMTQAGSAANQAGSLYYSQWHYASGKGEIAKLTPSGL